MAGRNFPELNRVQERWLEDIPYLRDIYIEVDESIDTLLPLFHHFSAADCFRLSVIIKDQVRQSNWDALDRGEKEALIEMYMRKHFL